MPIYQSEQTLKDQIIEEFKKGTYDLPYIGGTFNAYEFETISDWGRTLGKAEWIYWTQEGRMPCMPDTQEMEQWFDEAVKTMKIEVPQDLHSPFYIFFTGYLKQQYRKGVSDFKISFKNQKQFTIKPLDQQGESKEFNL